MTLNRKYFRYGFAPLRVAVESITDYFDTYIDHFSQKLRPLKVPPFFAWASLDMLSYATTWPYLILLSNERIFRALSDGINKIFSVMDLKNSFSVINQSTHWWIADKVIFEIFFEKNLYYTLWWASNSESNGGTMKPPKSRGGAREQIVLKICKPISGPPTH